MVRFACDDYLVLSHSWRFSGVWDLPVFTLFRRGRAEAESEGGEFGALARFLLWDGCPELKLFSSTSQSSSSPSL